MPSRALTSQRIVRGLSLGFVAVAVAGCPPPGSSGGGGITIAQTDATPPTLTVGAGQQGGPNLSVSAGGTGQNGTLVRKTGPLNVMITGTDPETGIQAVEIYYTSTVMYCTAATCTGPAAHGLVGAPRFKSTSPQMQPGQTTSASSTLADVLDLMAEIPQGAVAPGNTRIVKLYIWGKARNNLGGTATTPELVLTWTEP